MQSHPESGSLAISFSKRCSLILTGCLISSTLACESASGPDTESGRLIEQLTPAVIEATAGSVVDPGPSIRVTDERTGKPIAGITVEFRAPPGGGQVEKPFTTTDASGVATAGKWRVGNSVGSYGLKAIAAVYGSMAAFVVNIKPDLPARFSLMDTSIVGMAGEAIDWSGLRVVDRFGNGTPDISVAFTIETGGGALEKPTVITTPGGFATPGVWRLGSVGENVLIAKSAGIESAKISAHGLDPARVTRYSLDSVREGTTVRTPQSAGLNETTLTIATFDPCLCRGESGYYVIEVGYQYQPAVEPSRIMGRYRIESSRLVMVGQQIGDTGVDNGRISVMIQRNDPDWGKWTETWIFRQSSPGTP